MKQIIIFLAFTIFTGTITAQNDSDGPGIWNVLLTKYVSDDGLVYYTGLTHEKPQLVKYLDFLSNNTPEDNWPVNKKKAYWINVYNAFTISLILDNYPLKSITGIKENGKSAWDIKFIHIGETKYSLNDIENNILRKEFNDPRIHFAINCGSYSCPKLHNRSITANNLEIILDRLAKEFIKDKNKNVIHQSKIKISRVFEWYKGDFTKNGSLIDFLNKYSDIHIDENAKVEFMEYNWSLNKQK